MVYIAPRMGMAMADAFLEHNIGDGYEAWEGFYEYHKLGYDELEGFDYEAYRANGFNWSTRAKRCLDRN